MSWQVFSTDTLKAEQGEDRLLGYVEGLGDLLAENGLALPRFPEMAWANRTLDDGSEVAVGVTQDDRERLGYVWPVEKIEFDRVEEIALSRPAEGWGGRGPIALRWYRPTGR